MSEFKILDLSAGNRAMWFDKANGLVTYLDKRPCRSPDFVCDTTNIPDEVGSDFGLLVFDPPHENTGANSNLAKCYGHSTRPEIIKTIKGTAKEAHRVSKENALMAFKWNDKAWSLDHVLSLMAPYWQPLFGSHLRNHKVSIAKTQSYWVMLLRSEL